MSFSFRGTRGDIERGFSGFIRDQRVLRMQPVRPVNSNSFVFLITILLLFTILNSSQMSPNFLLWVVLGFFLIATSLRMCATCQQLQAQAQAQAQAAAASGLFGHTEVHFQMPPSIALAARGRLQGLRLQLALLDRDFDDLDYETLRALDFDNANATPPLSEEEINALPVHKYKINSLGSEELSSLQQASSSSASTEAKQEPRRIEVSMKAPEDELTCTICLEQAKKGELVRTLPCLHQFHANCIDPWLRQQGTCPVCKLRVESGMQETTETGADAADMV
ncbi:E3 ubiquitin-protein ligase sdir1 [Ancistrocladus abbreviatus]